MALKKVPYAIIPIMGCGFNLSKDPYQCKKQMYFSGISAQWPTKYTVTEEQLKFACFFASLKKSHNIFSDYFEELSS